MTVTNLERLGFEVHDVENMREHYQKDLRGLGRSAVGQSRRSGEGSGHGPHPHVACVSGGNSDGVQADESE